METDSHNVQVEHGYKWSATEIFNGSYLHTHACIGIAWKTTATYSVVCRMQYRLKLWMPKYQSHKSSYSHYRLTEIAFSKDIPCHSMSIKIYIFVIVLLWQNQNLNMYKALHTHIDTLPFFCNFQFMRFGLDYSFNTLFDSRYRQNWYVPLYTHSYIIIFYM